MATDVKTDSSLPASLRDLIELAKAADPSTRIEYRDPIAEFGNLAIDPMVDLLQHPRLGAFAVRVLDRVASRDGHRAEVVAALQRSRPAISAAPVARDVADLARRLDEESMLTNRATMREEHLDAARLATLRRQSLEDELKRTRPERIDPAWEWLRQSAVFPGAKSLQRIDAERLVRYLDRLDVILHSMGSGRLVGTPRQVATKAWLRSRLLPEKSRRASVCWNCRANVNSDLNPDCPTCRWMVCVCDACKEPGFDGELCTRMVVLGGERRFRPWRSED